MANTLESMALGVEGGKWILKTKIIMTIEELIEWGERLLAMEKTDAYGFTSVPYENYDEWKRMSLMFCQQNYKHHPQLDIMESHVSADNQSYHCQAILSILKAFREIQPTQANTDYEGILSNLFNRFPIVAKQLQRRHDGRNTIVMKDEYDVQDLLCALLRMFFEDVRPEEWSPSYAGGSKRMDFLLKEEEIAIEVKMTRKGLKDKELGEQLIIDIANYKQHKNCKCLYCFVYDPDGNIRNPRGIEKDLQALDKDLQVKVFIRPMY